jgi:hypothetical protein
MRDVQTAQGAELAPCELWPDALVWIQRRGIRREALEVEAWRRALAEQLLHGAAAVDGGALPDDDHPARHFAPQVFETRDHIVRVEGVVLAVEVELALRRDGTDRRPVVTGPPCPPDGGGPPGA